MTIVKGTYMTVLRGFCESLDGQQTTLQSVFRLSCDSIDASLQQTARPPAQAPLQLGPSRVGYGEAHNPPDALVGPVRSLVGALVLGDLVRGVDEASASQDQSQLLRWIRSRQSVVGSSCCCLMGNRARPLRALGGGLLDWERGTVRTPF